MKRAVADCAHGAAELPAPRPRSLFSRSRPASDKDACEECGGKEDLRVCQTCGYVGCCESHDAHDTAHFEKTGHFFIRPRIGDDWLWCYGCRAYLE
ncbi:MAG TPA: UBP-type zinc finger domain-containing protein [Thermoanaerobaculia bacterium]|jgi:CPA1 family monovalent cation:H+ antiporter|nr:UBP-type zinc finger domain-containing protein [Thermoanaerobaculia bacterium]